MFGKTFYLENGIKATEAHYREFPLPEFNDNPFIQALPTLQTKSSIIERLTVKPTYSIVEREIESHYRVHMLQRLFHFFQPLPIHIEIWEMMHTLLLDGYLARNPFDREYIKYMNASGQSIIHNTNISNNVRFRTTSSCGTLIGFSGMGKTTSVQKVLNNIPQIIVHNEYQGVHFNQIQLVWLKLDAPPTSSLKALCLQFFVKVDELLGTNNYQRYVSRNSSVDSMLPVISQLAHNIGLGILVIDELQNIRNRGAKQILNFFVNLINSGVNLALIGTPGSYGLFEEELRIARRLTGKAEITYENMPYDTEFKFLLESIWKYQWTKKYASLSEEIAKIFYEYTQGISDLMVKLFVYAQQFAMESGREELSSNLILKVAKERFKALNPMLDALKSGNPYRISKYEDIRKEIIVPEEKNLQQFSSEPSVKPLNSVVQNEIKQSNMNHQDDSRVDSHVQSEKNVNDIRSKVKQDESMSVYSHLLEEDYIDNLSVWK